MKNPFPNKLMVYKLSHGHILRADALHPGFTQDEADYIGHVFNQHDKLVRKLQELGINTANSGPCECRDCGGWEQQGEIQHESDCELAALLKAEEEL